MRWDAEKYDSVKAPQVEAGRDLIGMAGVKTAESVLDIGCGTGKLTLEIAALAGKGSVVGIDPSEEMLNRALAVSAGVRNLGFMALRAQEMDFYEKFDLAFSNSALQWIKRPDEQRAVIGKTFNALRPGGRIAFQMPAMTFCREFFEYAGRAMEAAGLERYFEGFEPPWYFPSAPEYEGFLKSAGFSGINVFYRDYALAFGSVKEVLDWWSSAGLRPYLAVLPKTRQEHFKYAFAMQFENNRTDKGIEFGFRRLFALAGKKGA